MTSLDGHWSARNKRDTPSRPKKLSISPMQLMLANVLLMQLLLWSACSCFNLDIATKLIHRGVRDSMFGFSVDMYKHHGDSWLLIGAPTSQSPQPGVDRGGQVFKCSTTGTRCSDIPFDSTGHNLALNGSELVQIDSKSEQWFGATVVASLAHDSVLACAPRYTYFYTTFEKKEPVGTCFLAQNDFTEFKEFSPCRAESKAGQRSEPYGWWGFHRLGFCQAGFSAALPRETDRLFIGAPGAWYWQGAIIKQSVQNVGDVFRTVEGPKQLDDSYLGYATATGDFNGDGVDDVVVGQPKGNHLTGLVAIYDHFVENLRNISGEQRGSYFGASIAITDLDGDGLDDIIVGAPLYTKYGSKEGVSKPQYEVGKVYAYFQGHSHTFTDSASVAGEQQWSRFGHAVAATGDLNGDGYNDFIVGAPYGGTNRKGSVFVFHGLKTGIREKYSQEISAEDVDSGLASFGFALAAGRDVDDNDYPDVLVGAYKSDRAILFKARPVITVFADMKLTPDVVNLENKACSLSTGELASCASLSICLRYLGKGAPQELVLELVVHLDAKKSKDAARAFFLDSEGNSKSAQGIPLIFDSQKCIQEHFYVLDGIRDKLTPIQIKANYSLQDYGYLRRGELTPALDTLLPEALEAKVEIMKDCGADEICVPDLKLDYKLLMCSTLEPLCREREKFSIGAAERLNLTVTVTNQREDAFESQFFLTIPPGLDYVRFVRQSETFPATCSAPTAFEYHDKRQPYQLTCDIGNPLPKGQTIVLSFEMATDNMNTAINEIGLVLKANTSNPEDNSTLDDNEIMVKIPLEVEVNLVINGVSFPETIAYEQSDWKKPEDIQFEADVGPNVTHVYEIRNDGPSTITEAKLDIYWPLKTIRGQYLLYLLKDPKYTGNLQCKVLGHVNPAIIAEGSGDQPVNHNRNIRAAPPPKEQQSAKDSTVAYDEEVRTTEGNVMIQSFRRLVNKIKELGGKFPKLGQELRALRVDCLKMDCVQLSCQVGELKSGDFIVITIESRLWVNTLIDDAFYDATISSVAMLQVLKVPYKHPPLEFPAKSAVVSTGVNPKDPTALQRGLPWWLILIAVLAGITFLILLALLLWKLGFFKRNRPPREKAELTRPPEGDYYGYGGYGGYGADQGAYGGGPQSGYPPQSEGYYGQSNAPPPYGVQRL